MSATTTRVILSSEQTDVAPVPHDDPQADGGEIALEGGGDGSFAQYSAAGKVGPIGAALVPATADTILRLVRMHEFADDLFCEETRNATVIGGSATSAVVTRLRQRSAAACEDVGVTFEILDDGVLLDKGTTGLNSGDPQAVNAAGRDRLGAAGRRGAAAGPGDQLRSRTIPTSWETVQWCTSWDPVDRDGGPPRWTLASPAACCRGASSTSTSSCRATERSSRSSCYDGAGDPMWR